MLGRGAAWSGFGGSGSCGCVGSVTDGAVTDGAPGTAGGVFDFERRLDPGIRRTS
ncbi:hypothetical protein GCM10009764_52680 [Nocardia ninae]|uniref:Uncharacterized protein n=1 Tax=Nocardia ninae NBRC 108245 TaxID=1210091 RepID=A0A511M690_9NOCA|nr:hypothetical protein NN4_06590 [Nocardia ninae NBRC 108245]